MFPNGTEQTPPGELTCTLLGLYFSTLLHLFVQVKQLDDLSYMQKPCHLDMVTPLAIEFHGVLAPHTQ